MAREKYQNFTEQEEEKRRQYYQQQKKKLPEYRKNYYLKQKNQLFGLFNDPKAIRFVSRTSPLNVWEILKRFYGFKDFVTIKNVFEHFL